MMSLKPDRATGVNAAKWALRGVACLLMGLSLNPGIAHAAPVNVTNDAVITSENLDGVENLVDNTLSTGATFFNGGKFEQSTIQFDFSSSGGMALSKIRIYKLNGDEDWDLSLQVGGSSINGDPIDLGGFISLYMLPGNSWYEIDLSSFGAFNFIRITADGDTPGYGHQNIGEIQLLDRTP